MPLCVLVVRVKGPAFALGTVDAAVCALGEAARFNDQFLYGNAVELDSFRAHSKADCAVLGIIVQLRAAADDAEQDADDATSEDAEAQAGATITDLNKLVELLEKNGAESIVRKDDESGIRSLDVKSSEAFAVLSNADASLYYDAQIKVIITGDAKLTESANNGMSFQGLGSDEHPFEGRIYRSLNGADSPVELTTDRTVFNSLKLTDQNNMVKIKWVGATSYSAPMVASKVSGAENGEASKTLIASVDIVEPVNVDVKDTTSALTAPLLGATTGDLAANVTYSLTDSRKNLNANATGNIGLIANTVESGSLTVESVTFPNDLTSGGAVKTSSGNAGLLVGEVKDGATLSIGTLANVPPPPSSLRTAPPVAL